jgi:hypothetical protein
MIFSHHNSNDTPPGINQDENSAQGAAISAREPSEMPRSSVESPGQIPTLNTVIDEQDTIDSFLDRFRSVQRRQKNIKSHLRKTRRWLHKRSHEPSHRRFVENLLNDHAKMGQDLKRMEEFMARSRLVLRESNACPGTCERLVPDEASHPSAPATWGGQADVQCQETSSLGSHLAGAGNVCQRPGKSLFQHHLPRSPF